MKCVSKTVRPAPAAGCLKKPVGVRVTEKSLHAPRLLRRPVACAYRKGEEDAGAPAEDAGADGEACEAFVDRDGQFVPVMCADYGFRSGSGRLYQEHYAEVPASALELGWLNFKHEFAALRRFISGGGAEKLSATQGPGGAVAGAAGKAALSGLKALDAKLVEGDVLRSVDELVQEKAKTEPTEAATDGEGNLLQDDVRAKLAQLTLDNDAVWEREEKRGAAAEAAGRKSPLLIKGFYLALCYVLDLMYDKRPIARFWTLEVVARMPYFAYISMLHLYESMGWWRAGAELRKVHFAEEWNELHHLQIMESLGGDQLWIDRFIAQHSAVVYFWGLILFYLTSPRLAYNFSELVEGHATDTYEQFVEENEALLKELPPPLVALEYYRGSDLYMFDAFQTGAQASRRKAPICRNLYDVFEAIRDDEVEHEKTMVACQDQSIALELSAAKRVSNARFKGK